MSTSEDQDVEVVLQMLLDKGIKAQYDCIFKEIRLFIHDAYVTPIYPSAFKKCDAPNISSPNYINEVKNLIERCQSGCYRCIEKRARLSMHREKSKAKK